MFASTSQQEAKGAESLKVRRWSAGRAVSIQRDGTLYAGRGYHIFSTCDEGRSWQFVTCMPADLKRSLAGRLRLASRLLRVEVRALGVLSDGTVIASNRGGVYRAEAGEPVMNPCAVDCGGQPPAPPMTITVGPADRVLWGEYDSRTAHGRPVRLFVSQDGGRNFHVARVFPGGSILHVHNLIFDPILRKYWLLAGDHDDEPGIGLLSEDLREFDWVAKGEQKYRAVEVFDFGDRLVYGIDSERESNAIVSFEKASARVERLVELEGSCIYATRFGGIYALSTTVEPSAVNKSNHADLWLSRDGERWMRVLRALKDRWHPRYFQYGSLVLPRGASDRETIYFSGQALEGLDGRLAIAEWGQESGDATGAAR